MECEVDVVGRCVRSDLVRMNAWGIAGLRPKDICLKKWEDSGSIESCFGGCLGRSVYEKEGDS